MKYTLLQIVQSYLNRVDGFYVDSIFETDESQSVAQVAEEVFEDLVQDYRDILSFQKDINLDSVSDTTKPNYLLIPDNFQRIHESKLWYNVSKDTDTHSVDYRSVAYLTPSDFMELMSTYTDNNPNTEVVEGFDGTKTVVTNNRMPTYFTSFDGKYIVCDSYDKEQETTLQASKTKCLANTFPDFLLEDNFVIPLPDDMQALYRQSVVDEAMSSLHQQRDPLIAQKARKNRLKIQQKNRVVGDRTNNKKSKGRGK